MEFLRTTGVRYVLTIDGTKVEEELPVGTMRLRCDHCGTLNDLSMHQLQPTSIRLVVPRLPENKLCVR